MALTKALIVEKIYTELGCQKAEAVEAIEVLLELIKKELVAGHDVMISGFGKFCVRAKKERLGRNPATGEDLMLRPRRVVTFQCSGKLKEKVNREGR